MSSLRIYWRVVLCILVLQCLIGIAEAANILACNFGNGECWPWFFIFTINLPISYLAMQLIGAIPLSESFYPGLILYFVVLVFAGTVQWSLLCHLIVWFFALLKQVIRRTNA